MATTEHKGCQMATEFAVQVIPNRFPIGEFGRFSVSLNAHVNHCKTIIYDGAPGRIRTLNLLIRSQVLYPIELRALLSAIG